MRLHRIFFAAQALIFLLLAGYLWSWGNWLGLLAVGLFCGGVYYAREAMKGCVKTEDRDDAKK